MCWKYWHSAKNHALSLAIVVAYDIYKEICEGHINPQFHNPNPVSFFSFRDTLSKQMLQYDPLHQSYPGDDKMRCVTQVHKSKRRKTNSVSTNDDVVVINRPCAAAANANGLVSIAQYRHVCNNQSRFCDLQGYAKHLSTIYTSTLLSKQG